MIPALVPSMNTFSVHLCTRHLPLSLNLSSRISLELLGFILYILGNKTRQFEGTLARIALIGDRTAKKNPPKRGLDR